MFQSPIAIISLLTVMLFSGLSEAKPRVAVSKFSDKTGNGRCKTRGWAKTLGDGFRDQIATSLMKTRKVTVVERENLKNMYQEEHELINADTSTQPQKNKFKAAHYSITGAVTEFELCAGGIGGKLDVGGLIGLRNSGLKVGGEKATAEVTIDIRVIDTETGEVVSSFASKGDASKVGFDVNGDIKGANFASNAFKSSPLGEATRKAIEDAVVKIVAELPDKTDLGVASSNKASTRRTASAHNHDGARSARAQRAESRDNHICEDRARDWDGDYSACRVLAVSSSGKLVKVLNQRNGKHLTLRPTQIFRLSPLKEAPKIGKIIAVSTNESGINPSSASQKKYHSCTISDSFEEKFVLNCKGKEYEVSENFFFERTPFAVRNTASK